MSVQDFSRDTNQLQSFVVALSQSPRLRRRFEEDAETVLGQFGLDGKVADLLERGDLEGMRRHMDDRTAAAMIQVSC
jgi:hypothetical protein